MSRNNALFAGGLAAVVLIAAALRLPGYTFSLPYCAGGGRAAARGHETSPPGRETSPPGPC